MAQTRYQDVLKMAKGFNLIAKAFCEHQTAEIKQVWNNSSIWAAAQEIQFQVEENISDSMVSEVSGVFLC